MSAAYEIPVLLDGQHAANADLSTKQFLAVALTSGKVDVASAAGNCMGVLQNNPTANQPATVMVLGVTKMVAGAALATAGTAVEIDGSGRAVAKSAGVAIGRTVTTASGAGALVSVNLIPN